MASDRPTTDSGADDRATARAFADSWNNLPTGSIYTDEQFRDWIAPLGPDDIAGKRVLELGCGNGSLMLHMSGLRPLVLDGVELGDAVLSARANLGHVRNCRIIQADLTTYTSQGYDVVYCIGVLHHLKNPRAGFEAVVANTVPGGRFHCWVYAQEGNALIIHLVEPLRKLASRLPWPITKYLIATPLAVPFFLYAKLVSRLPLCTFLPLQAYCAWIAKREFAFFRHVAFDQLVTPQTAYIPRNEIEAWIKETPGIDLASTYILMRNGNSWKFGARRSGHAG